MIIKKKRKDDLNLKFEYLKISKNTLIVLIVAAGVSLFALGILFSVGYNIKGDAWIGIGSANYIGKHQIKPIDYGKDRNYPIFWGYIIFGLASLTGIPFMNTNALLAPFCYLSITSMYLFIKSILKNYNENYAVLSTILISIYGGFFCFYPLIINQWGSISHYTFRSQFNFDYKTFAYLLLYISISLFFIKSDEDFDMTSKKFYRSEDFKVLFLSSYVLVIAFMIYMIPLIIGIYIIFLNCFFSERINIKRRFQSFKLHLILLFILFFIFDISADFFLSHLYYKKYSKYFDFPKIFNKFTFTYGSFIGLILFISFIKFIRTKSLLDRYKKHSKLNVNPKYLFILLLSLFTIFVLINVYNIIFIFYTYKYIFFLENYWYYAIIYIFLYIGIIGIIGIYLSYFCFKKYRDLFYFLTSWVIISISYSLYLFFIITFDTFQSYEINSYYYLGAINWFEKNWFSAIPAFSTLASIGSIELLNFLKYSKKISRFHIGFRNRNFIYLFKLSVVSLLIITSYSNVLIGGAIQGNIDEKLTEAEANVLGWVTENLNYDSRILIENDYEIHCIISSFFERDSCYFLPNYGGKTGLFYINNPYLEQLDEIKRRNVEYAIFYDDHPGASSNDIDFIDNYLLPEIYSKELYRYKNLAVYYAPEIEDIGVYELRDYNGTFSFDNDEIGAIPLGWNVSLASNKCYIKILGSYLSHRKIMQIFDNDVTVNAYATQNFNSPQAFGTIEFWIFHSYPSNNVKFGLAGKGLFGPLFLIRSDGWFFHDGVTYRTIPYVEKPSAYKWHHVRIDFESGNNGYLGLNPKKYRIFVNGINSGELDFKGSPISIENFVIETDITEKEYENLYLDAIGYSWDLNYDIGDNLFYSSIKS
ncbi:MAG: hypothetical protein EU529_04250 [Promethearchaeota archaeon]|nr:MAG: hypothetical protein EU529_04250 [Candidatus Lokiarchaeota archaeon]